MNETPYKPPGSYWGLLGVSLGSYSLLDRSAPQARDRNLETEDTESIRRCVAVSHRS